MEWLLAPIDPTRAHEVGWAVSWHARAMTLAWGIIVPLAVLIARYLKVLPGQDWPRALDSQVWWRIHWIGQSFALLLTLIGLGLIWGVAQGGSLHGRLGYTVLILTLAQITLGIFRGSKGGPTCTNVRGDHYDMTPWRVTFEWAHKLLGYALIMMGVTTILFGLWHANAPVWMWLTLTLYWSCLLVAAIVLQNRGWAIDTYQAIWGPDPRHPGNRRKPVGFGIRQVKERN